MRIQRSGPRDGGKGHTKAGLGILVLAAVALSPAPADAQAYPNARALYADCSAGVAGLRAGVDDTDTAVKLRKCRNFLKTLVDQWTRDIDANNEGLFPCYRYRGELIEYTGDPHRYLQYWDSRGFDFLEGYELSAGASVYEFLNSDAMTTCVRSAQ